MRQLTLAERAATATAMSAEQVAMCDDVANQSEQGLIIRNLCASHEALRRLRKTDADWAAEKFARLFEFAEMLDKHRMHAIAEELFAILRG